MLGTLLDRNLVRYLSQKNQALTIIFALTSIIILHNNIFIIMKDKLTAEYFFQEFQPNQARTLNRAAEAYKAYLGALQAARPLKGGMHWKKIKGRDYLYKYRDRYGRGHSLGPRSPDTERLWDEFLRQRRETAAVLAEARRQMAEAARFCRAALIHRVPEPVVRVLRRLTPGDPAGTPFLVIDTHALHAYEFGAGVFINGPRESPLWAEAARGLTLAATAAVTPDGFLHLLRRADRSYQGLTGDGLAAVNRQGFRVRLIYPTSASADPGNLAALMGAPKFTHIVIGRRGDPVVVTVPDPRAMALHKLWLSRQEDREPWKRARDRCQAAALAELVLRYLPQYHFFSADLQMFPAEVARLAENLVEGYEVSPELEAE
jgi:hypothetical protein